MRLLQATQVFVLLTGSAAFALASTISISGGTTDFPINEEPNVTFAVRSLGQVFVVPTPLNKFVLTSFGFTVDFVQANVDYRGYVYEWDAVDIIAVGPALYTSPALTALDPPSFFGLSLVLDPAKEYIAFLTTQGGPNDTTGTISLVTNNTDPYGSGAAFIQFAEQPFANSLTGDWTTMQWIEVLSTDAQFEATFVEGVPEPSTFAVAAIALATLAFSRLRGSRPQA